MTHHTLVLVDGSSYLYRAYHALPDLRGPGGVPTGAIHGMVGMMRLLRETYPTPHAACVFDAKGKTFRDDLYPEYKAQRKAMPEDLALQIEPIREVVRLLGWPVIEVPGIEADDAIGTIACAAAKGGHRVIISTGDKDLAQLVTAEVSLVNTMARPPEVLDVAGVLAKFGVPPERMIDYLTLIGDSVDNVPGVDKVGPKTAAKWIADHGSLDGVIAAAASIKGVVGDNLRKARDWLPQGKRLVTILTDCDLAGHLDGWPGLDALVMREPDREGLMRFYERYGFRTLKKELEAMPGNAEPAPPVSALPHEYETVFEPQRLHAWISRLREAPVAALACETDSPEPMRARIVGLSFALKPGEAAYVPVAHNAPGAPEQLTLDAVLAALKPWLEDERAAKVGHNTKTVAHAFANHGIAVRGWAHDTLLQSYVLEAHRRHDLENLAERHLNRKTLTYEGVCGKGAGQIPFAQLDMQRATEYAGERAEVPLHLHHALHARLMREAGLLHVYERIEMPVCAVLAKIERHGVLVDTQALARQSKQLAERMLALEQEAYALAGQPFNLGSPKQIGDVLFGRLGLPVKRKTASGAPSTDEDVLQELAQDYPLPARILEHRAFSKLKGTYTDKLPLMVNPETGRVHTTYGQAVAVTGRLASNDPNLQNIPIRTAEGRRIREAFIAPPAHHIVSADYSQIELRIMAHISGDEGLRRAFSEGMDVHRATASEVFAVPPDQVSSEQRRYAKVINFGLIYGMSAFGLAQNLGIERSAATQYISRYFQRFAGVKRYMDDTRAKAAQLGYVETMFGRRIELPDIRGGSGPRRAGAERQAINAPMQGTAADLIKMAMLAVQDALDAQRKRTKMIMQVHDELVFEVPDDELDWTRAELPKLMSGVAQLAVPLVAEVGAGLNWDEAH
ncbi:MAG: DNA polymerase I [Burkholderiaceae bacterium]|nr:DNA polymerase I [Burkholderiaceae bacterium]